MRVIESLEIIQVPWLSRASHQLARGTELRENTYQLLDEFFRMIRQAVETGDPAWIDGILDNWVGARTQSELEVRESSLTPIINRILLLTFEIIEEHLAPDDALALLEALLPIYLHAFEYTARKEMESNIEHISKELVRVNASLERLDRSKSDFIAIAAHELKTPLTLIEGYTAILREQISPSEEYQNAWEFLQGVDNGTRRLREIIDDMVDVSLIDNNLLSLHFQPVWINRILKVLQSEFLQTVSDRNQTLDVHYFPGCEEMTFGDEERLFQAFRNMFSNAIKFTPDGGTIVIDGRKLPGFIEVTIADSGIGIDPVDHVLIFEKFGRLGRVSLHSSGKTKFKGGGPGLGLPITKGIIEAHGGAIWVESEGYNETRLPGSTFHILLPILKAPPDDRIAKLFRPLVEIEESDSLNQIS